MPLKKDNPSGRVKILSVLLGLPVLALAQTVVEPASTPYGTTGMSQVISAEALGTGRMSLQLRGNFFKQDHETFPGAPIKGSQIATLTGGLALGVNPYLDIFGSAGVYNLNKNTTDNGARQGSSVLGLQTGIPLSKTVPARLGLQVAAVFGTSKSQINTNGADGYNYFETRAGTDFIARLVQSFLFTDKGTGVKLHFNEGLVSSLEPGKERLILSGAGIEFIPTPSLIFGLEINSRTSLNKFLTTDPLWTTPSMVIRTPVHVNLQLGTDLSLSKNRTGTTTRALEPWRVFGSITYSYDFQADSRRRRAEEERAEGLERAEMASKVLAAQHTMDSLTWANFQSQIHQKQVADSLALKAKQDSLAMAQRAKQDSAGMAEKARQDSIALAQSQKLLDEERAKRSDAEKQLLSTGLLLLDAVYFETGKTEISINSKPYLNIIAKMLTKYPKLRIEVSGHSDNVGSLAYNMRLSEGRAVAVAQYMGSVAPELQSSLSAKGYGPNVPKADNRTPEGRKFNRRTELQVLNKEVLKEYNP